MKIFKTSACMIGLSLAISAQSDQSFDIADAARLNVFGFGRAEAGYGWHTSSGLQNCVYPVDPRGVFGVRVPNTNNQWQCQPGPEGYNGSHMSYLGQLGADLEHEFDNAWKISTRYSYRMRDGNADIPGYGVLDRSIAASHPVYGEARLGAFATRSWSRSDSFSYPLGLSSQWSETGAGYGAVKNAIRYTSQTFELDGGKLVLEGTFAKAKVNRAVNSSQQYYDETPPKPSLAELFAQYSKENLLIEYVFQGSVGGQQSSWAKGGFVGDYGNADNNPNYKIPKQNVNIVQGTYYFAPLWSWSFGARRNYWTGAPAQGDYVPSLGYDFNQYGGFNNNGVSATNSGYPASSYDFMSGIAKIDGDTTYTAGVVRLNKAKTSNPIEVGQSNAATLFNLGIYQKANSISPNLSIYAGYGWVLFDHLGSAPLSMSSQIYPGGVDPRTNRVGSTLTLGAKWAL